MPRLDRTQSKLRVYELLLQINTGFDTVDRALATLDNPNVSTTRNSRTSALFRQKLEPPSPPTSRALSKLRKPTKPAACIDAGSSGNENKMQIALSGCFRSTD